MDVSGTDSRLWHFQQRYAGDDVLELPLGWMSGAIVNLNGR